eukprot:scaffold217825_cov32-Prasinocladus_malaysianus.AAC.4
MNRLAQVIALVALFLVAASARRLSAYPTTAWLPFRMASLPHGFPSAFGLYAWPSPSCTTLAFAYSADLKACSHLRVTRLPIPYCDTPDYTLVTSLHDGIVINTCKLASYRDVEYNCPSGYELSNETADSGDSSYSYSYK